MPNREVVIKVTTQTEEAVSGVKAAGDAVKGLGTAGTAAKAGLDPAADSVDRLNKSAESGKLKWSDLRAEIEKLPPAERTVSLATLDVVAALQKMEAAGERSPALLAKGAALAQVKVEALKKAMEDAAAAGVKMGPNAAAGIAVFEKQIQSASVRAADFRDRLGDMKKAGELSATGFEAAASSAGSFGGMLSGIANSSTGAAASMAKIGIAGGAIIASFTAGLAAGKEFDGWLKQHGFNLSDVMIKGLAFAQGIDIIDDKLAHASIVQKSHIGQTHAQAQAFEKLTEAMAKTSPALDAWLKRQDEGKQLTADLTKILGAFGGSLEKQSEWVQKFGKHMASDFVKALADGTLSTKTLDAAQAKLLQQIIATGDEAQKAAEKLVAGKKKEIEATEKALQVAIRTKNEKLKALNEENLSDEEFNARKKKILDDMRAALEKNSDAEAALADLQKKKMGEVDESYKGVDATVGALAATYEKQQEVTKQVAVAQDHVKSGIEGMTLASGAGTKALGETHEGMSKLHAAAEKAADATEKAGKAITIIGTGAEKAGTALPKVGDALVLTHKGAFQLVESGGKLEGVFERLKTKADDAASSIRILGSELETASRKAATAAGGGGGMGDVRMGGG